VRGTAVTLLPTHWYGPAGVCTCAGDGDIALWYLAARAPSCHCGGYSWHADSIEAYNTDGGWLNLSERDLVRETSIRSYGPRWQRVKIKVGKSDGERTPRRVRAVARRSARGPPEYDGQPALGSRHQHATANRILPTSRTRG